MAVAMDQARRIVSFLPSATEMICALGLADRLVGVTHECDFPPEVRDKPVVVRSALPTEGMGQSEVDTAVTERLRNGLSLYQVDERLLQAIAPDLIVTQDLCQVCAPSGNEVAQVLSALPTKPKILWLTPKSLGQIFENLHELGAATGRTRQAEEIIVNGRARLQRIAAQASRGEGAARIESRAVETNARTTAVSSTYWFVTGPTRGSPRSRSPAGCRTRRRADRRRRDSPTGAACPARRG